MLHHLLRHAKAHGHAGGQGGRAIARAVGHGLAHLVFHVVVQVANGGHAGALVYGLLHLGRHRDVFQNKTGDFQPVFIHHRWVDDLHQRLAQIAVARGDIEHGDFGLGQRLAENTHDARAHGVGKLIQAKVLVGARHFFQEQRRLHDAKVVRAKGANAHHAKVGVAHRHWVGRAPFVAREQARVDVVHIAFKGRLKTVFPAVNGR